MLNPEIVIVSKDGEMIVQFLTVATNTTNSPTFKMFALC